ncbi:MAG: hypothetical protein P9M06_00815, partial [Candidatus Saelkia tenebricola]|nr:hypothetical protein [Candidatus Saelkia tenebricola]
IEINDAFDEKINDPDYARKLFLVENCIYGVDIQEIAAQISKLRFFISLIVDQKVDKDKPNFGIRVLPNLETKFVAGNTLIGIEKPKDQLTIFNDNKEVKDLVKELENVRHRLFSAKSPPTKRRLRDKDKEIREELSNLLEILFNDEVEDVVKNNRRVSELKYYHDMIKRNGSKDNYLKEIAVREKELDKIKEDYKSENHKTAIQLARWDPYDQNASSPFFDPEWMFGIRDGFDIVIGNPPYGAKISKSMFGRLEPFFSKLFCMESAILFIEKGRTLLSANGTLTYIVPKALTYASNYKKTRDYLLKGLSFIVDCGKAFEQVKLEACVFSFKEGTNTATYNSVSFNNNLFTIQCIIDKKYVNIFELYLNSISQHDLSIALKLLHLQRLENYTVNRRGGSFQKNISEVAEKPMSAIGGKEIDRYGIRDIKGYVGKQILKEYSNAAINPNAIICQNIVAHILNPTDHIKIIACINNKENGLILDTINQITINNETISKYYLWSILNSTLINWYVYRFIYGKAIRTMHFDNPVTSRIPIALPTNLNLYKILYYLTIMSERETIFVEIIDSLIFQEYFSLHMKELKIDILDFVEKDLEEILQNKCFDQLTENQKEKVMEQLHTKWTNPKSEIVKRMNSFAEKSPDILKPILESK